MDARADLGRRGEAIAADLYRHLGFVLVDKNFRGRAGEIDLVARSGRLLVFCEVKTRRSSRYGEPSEAVDPRKQARLRRLAAEWIAARRPGASDIRFDVVSVIVGPARVDLTHIPDAF